jgi:hypothetical protein
VARRHLDSSGLAAAGYDAGHHQLTLAFRHDGLYRYFDVSRRTCRALLQGNPKASSSPAGFAGITGLKS